jgi:CubicO group peptidase (beta-lactamase class C family)
MRRTLVASLVFGFATSVLPLGSGPPAAAADPMAPVIARYRERIPALMAERAIPGLAVALVDADHELWVEGFGHLDGPDSAPVTRDTIFGIQSMSKLFTATAVMQAVAADRLDLDEPITTYLPGFTIHSAFEEHAERRITLRMLLSHTAGFTFDAPIGNNNDLDAADFDAHVRSISATWLRFPVGTGYAYSNLGIDLAGYILERVEGKPFPEMMRDSLLEPLGMDRSTFDRAVIRSADDRAVGHVDPFPEPPLEVPMTAAGGMYASAGDLARFLRFQLNDGSLDGRVVLDPEIIEEMRTVPPPHAGAAAGYALGVVRHRLGAGDQAPDAFDHGGGGFGFQAELWWAPQLGIGVAILSNSEDQQPPGDLALSILGDLVAELAAYRERLLALPDRPAIDDANVFFEPPPHMADLVAAAARAPTGDEAARWAARAGSFGAPKWGVVDPTGPAGRFFVDGGVPTFEVNEEGSLVQFRLVEIEPGVFLAGNGETLDMARPVPTWRSFRLVRLTGGPMVWQWAILGIVAVLAAAWLIAAAVRAVSRRRSRPRSTEMPWANRRWSRIAAGVAAMTALLTLGTVALIASMPGLVDSGFLGWLDFPIVDRLAFHLPLALAVGGGGTVVLLVAGWIRRWWSKAVTAQYAVLALGAIALVGQLAAWNLIGWGWG